MQENAPIIHDHLKSNNVLHVPLECGDIQRGFRESDLVLKERFTTQAQAHCCLEPQCSLATFDMSGRLTVWTNTQSPHELRSKLSEVCGLTLPKIRVIKPHVGGGFGRSCKMEGIEPVSVFLAKAAGRPVKIQYTREEEFFATRTRHPTIIDIKMGVKKDGTLMAKQIREVVVTGRL